MLKLSLNDNGVHLRKELSLSLHRLSQLDAVHTPSFFTSLFQVGSWQIRSGERKRRGKVEDSKREKKGY
jgi:hypothetical protein